MYGTIDLVITVPADVLAPNGAKPSTGIDHKVENVLHIVSAINDFRNIFVYEIV